MKLKKCIPFFGITIAILTAIPVSASSTNMDNVRSLTQLSSTKETEEGTTPQSDSDEQIKVQNDSDSGNVYDFKDSKTSGVVTATKIWEDRLSNDERTIPDISISTTKPRKNMLGYTITYHGNGLTFADGNTENEILVNSSGKILSGQYKELSGSLGWYSDKACTQNVELGTDGLPTSEITSDMDIYAKPKTFVLKKGLDFNNTLMSSSIKSIVFTDEVMPSSAELIDVDADGDGGVVAWLDGSIMKVSSQISGQKVIANKDCSDMFSDRTLYDYKTDKVTSISLVSIEFTNLDTGMVENANSMFNYCSSLKSLDLSMLDFSNLSQVSDMTRKDAGSYNGSGTMFGHCKSLVTLKLPQFTNKITHMACLFSGCSSLESLDLSLMDTSNVIDMSDMFNGCKNLTSLSIGSFNTSKAEYMDGMFFNCSKISKLDLSSFDTSNVSSMKYMFSNCYNLTALSLGDNFAFIGSDYSFPSGTWYSSDDIAYSSNGTTCSIPNNKADTYTKR